MSDFMGFVYGLDCDEAAGLVLHHDGTNVLWTGAAGYVGGLIVGRLLVGAVAMIWSVAAVGTAHLVNIMM